MSEAITAITKTTTRHVGASTVVAFLFLGELLLVPHLYPIVEALAELAPDTALDVWVATSVHEALIAGWLAERLLTRKIRIRRAPGFRRSRERSSREQWEPTHPSLPSKFWTLLRLLPRLLRTDAIVCAEQTSLYLAQLFPFLHLRFIKAAHGAGSMMNRDSPRRRAAFRLLVPAELEKQRLIACGVEPARVRVVGYVKSSFRHFGRRRSLFVDDKPVIVYAPHWQRTRSSWWQWGSGIVAMLVQQQRWNVILAPHQRLQERAPDVRAVLSSVAHLPHVRTDLESFAMVDGTYMAAADLYLGDTSSQVVEFLVRPRPCVFLNAQRVDWRATDDHDFWRCGEVVDDIEQVPAAIGRAFDRHAEFERAQREFIADAIGPDQGDPATRAAQSIIEGLRAEALR